MSKKPRQLRNKRYKLRNRNPLINMLKRRQNNTSCSVLTIRASNVVGSLLVRKNGGQTSQVWLNGSRNQKIIYHSFFSKERITPQLAWKLYQFDHVVENYYGIKGEEKEKLQDTLYMNAKSYLAKTRAIIDEPNTVK